MIVALAGRRIDSEGSPTPRFPIENAPIVADRIRSSLRGCPVSALVCSAARGADLLALEVAGKLGIRRYVVLSSDASSFRAASVVDGLTGEHQDGYEWGELFDQIHEAVKTRGDLLVCTAEAAGHRSYLAANRAILDRAAKLASVTGEDLLAILVWDLSSRGPNDVTAAFRDEAIDRGIRIKEIATL